MRFGSKYKNVPELFGENSKAVRRTDSPDSARHEGTKMKPVTGGKTIDGQTAKRLVQKSNAVTKGKAGRHRG